MAEKILTDEEKNALLDGVESGEVEVHSSAGPAYASVTPFEIAPRSRIVKDSYPRLRLLNQQVADRLTKQTEALLQCEIQVTPRDVRVRSYGEFRAELAGTSAITVFEAPPLQGRALIVMEPSMVRHLVDTFFGGTGEDAGSDVERSSAFTPGELSVSRLFANVVLSTIKDVWSSFYEIAPEQVDSGSTIDVIDIAAETDAVLGAEFEVSTAEKDGTFRILWPVQMIKPLMPAFDGQKIDRDPQDDLRWKSSISRRVADSIISISANVGHARMTLGSLIDLAPGDVIEIDDPHRATLLAKNVPLVKGRFGVHSGQNAVEATDWLDTSLST